jgi:hypothetical protein
MSTHFMLLAKARTLKLRDVYAAGEDAAFATFCDLRWPETNGKPVCPKCGCPEAHHHPPQVQVQECRLLPPV